MKKVSQKSIIKVSKNISLYYSIINRILIIKGPLIIKILKLTTKLLISKKTRIIKVTADSFVNISKHAKKHLKKIKGILIANLKQTLYEVSNVFFKKLKLIGTGYKAFLLKFSEYFLLNLKLGYSHNIYFKIPKAIKVLCLKSNSRIYIYGNLLLYVSQIAALIRSYKSPEPYKGKGILYANESIFFKEGKKI